MTFLYKLKKINTSPLRILYMLMLQIIPLLTLMLICMWYEESTPSLGISRPQESQGEVLVIEVAG